MGPDRPLDTLVSEDNSQEVAQGTLGLPEVGFSLSRQLGKWPRHHLRDGRVRGPLVRQQWLSVGLCSLGIGLGRESWVRSHARHWGQQPSPT